MCKFRNNYKKLFQHFVFDKKSEPKHDLLFPMTLSISRFSGAGQQRNRQRKALQKALLLNE
jgi:lipoate-protein ligase A